MVGDNGVVGATKKYKEIGGIRSFEEHPHYIHDSFTGVYSCDAQGAQSPPPLVCATSGHKNFDLTHSMVPRNGYSQRKLTN